MDAEPGRGVACLSLYANFAETEHHAATGSWAAKTHLRAEARKQENLVELTAHGGIIGAGKNVVVDDAALRIQGRFHQQHSRISRGRLEP